MYGNLFDSSFWSFGSNKTWIHVTLSFWGRDIPKPGVDDRISTFHQACEMWAAGPYKGVRDWYRSAGGATSSNQGMEVMTFVAQPLRGAQVENSSRTHFEGSWRFSKWPSVFGRLGTSGTTNIPSEPSWSIWNVQSCPDSETFGA